MNLKRLTHLIFGEFRASTFRTLLDAPRFRVVTATRFSVRGLKRIHFSRQGYLHLGTTYYGFIDRSVRSLIRVRGRIEVGGSVRVARGARWDIGRKAVLFVGDGTYFSPFTMIVATHRIRIGEGCAIGWGVQLLDDNLHSLLGQNVSRPSQNVTIGDHVWVGSNVQILPGVTIASGCIVGAGSVVTGSFLEEGCVIAGVPARVIKTGVVWV